MPEAPNQIEPWKMNADGHLSDYQDYARILRAWLVAYGIGGPVLFLTNDALSLRIAQSGMARWIALAFLIGVAAQVVSAMINKWAAYVMYLGAVVDGYKDRLRYSIWGWINEQTWLDVTCDAITLVAFASATWVLMDVVTTA